MIHAYCFVLGIREGNGGHGPNFIKLMTGINRLAGTAITIYHSFHDEVSLYKTHWWRCDGVCQNRKPYYGFVKRTSNRAPGANDFWFRQHQETCGESICQFERFVLLSIVFLYRRKFH
jgi:SprT-like domain-contaning protein Spartan